MPYFQLHTSRTLSGAEKHGLCEEIGKLMPLLPGKSRDNTMMCVMDGCYMELGGAEPALNLDVRLFKPSPAENKKAFAEKISALLGEKLGVKPERMSINIAEHSCWTSGGVYME
jgi:phenylpyruvate tautomerase PptA (4-oxalocrotonate tautomerase family)